jgi:hypothetical protein
MTETRLDTNAFLAKEPIGKLLLEFSVPCVIVYTGRHTL